MAIVTSHFCCVFSKTTYKYGIAFDNFNQSIVNSARPNDQVVGCTLGQLEDASPSAWGSWWRWRTRIRKMYNNPTENAALDYLFREYR